MRVKNLAPTSMDWTLKTICRTPPPLYWGRIASVIMEIWIPRSPRMPPPPPSPKQKTAHLLLIHNGLFKKKTSLMFHRSWWAVKMMLTWWFRFVQMRVHLRPPKNHDFTPLSIKRNTVLKLGTTPFNTYFFMVQIAHLLNLWYFLIDVGWPSR